MTSASPEDRGALCYAQFSSDDYAKFSRPPPFPPSVGGLDLNSSNRGCARLGSGVAPPLGVVKEEVAVLIALVRRHRRAVGAAVRWAVDDEVPGAVEEETGPAAVRRVSPGLLDALPVHALGALGIIVVVRDVGPRQVVCDDVADAAHVL